MTKPGTIRTDVLIIGAGPVGLHAAFHCGMADLSCHVIDALPFLGGQCKALYPEKPIHDIPGFVAIPAGELVDRLVDQLSGFVPGLSLGDAAVDLECLADGGWAVTTASGRRHEAAAVILAAGAGGFQARRPPLAGLDAYEGRSAFFAVNDVSNFAGRRVVIAGGGDSAADWALELARHAAEVHLVHRRAQFTCAPASARMLHDAMASGRITLHAPYQLHGLEGAAGDLDAVLVRDFDGAVKPITADRLLMCFGMSQSLGPLANWGFSLEGQRICVEPEVFQTTLPGIHAIGDVAAYPGKRKLILCGFSEAAMAVAGAFVRARPDGVLSTEHSTSRGLPGRGAGAGGMAGAI